MKLTSPKTYKVVRYALESGTFKQLEAQKATGVSFGLVNRVTQWMVSRKFAAVGTRGYDIIAPAALAQTFSVFRRMEDLRIGAYMVETNQNRLQTILKENGAVLCLTSALAHYDDYFRDPSIQVYGSEQLGKALFEMPSGRMRVDVYEDDLKDDQDVISDKGIKRTGKIRTLIDLLCSDRAYAADRLIKKTWG